MRALRGPRGWDQTDRTRETLHGLVIGTPSQGCSRHPGAPAAVRGLSLPQLPGWALPWVCRERPSGPGTDPGGSQPPAGWLTWPWLCSMLLVSGEQDGAAAVRVAQVGSFKDGDRVGNLARASLSGGHVEPGFRSGQTLRVGGDSLCSAAQEVSWDQAVSATRGSSPRARGTRNSKL